MTEKKYDKLKLENQLCFPIYAASRELIKLYRPHLEPLDLTYTQYITMMVIWEEKKVNVKNLGKRLFLDSGTLTPVLKNLESKGYIRRYRSVEDERVLYVEVTENGNKLKERATAVHDKMREYVKLTDEETLQLYTLMYKLLKLNNIMD